MLEAMLTIAHREDISIFCPYVDNSFLQSNQYIYMQGIFGGTNKVKDPKKLKIKSIFKSLNVRTGIMCEAALNPSL